MSINKIPEGNHTITPYLILNEAARFMEFVTKVFNAEIVFKAMRDDETIMHAELKIGDSKIMFADGGEQWKTQPAGLFIYVDDADTTYNKALDSGAQVVTPLANQSYGRSGGVKDPFGNTWWITSVSQP